VPLSLSVPSILLFVFTTTISPNLFKFHNFLNFTPNINL
jgi:hypothetical protein